MTKQRWNLGIGIIALIALPVSAVSIQDLMEHLILEDEADTIITTDADGGVRATKVSIDDIDHEEIVDSFRDKDSLTREQFAYLLDLLTHDVDAIRDVDRCGFSDYETAQSMLGLAAVNSLCHKGIVRGTYQRKYYYNAKLTEAEAITMVVRAKFLEEYDHLRDLEISAPAGQRYQPYYDKARRENMLVGRLGGDSHLRPVTPVAALQLLEKNFGSVDDTVTDSPLSTIIYQTIHDDRRAHVVRWIRDRQGEEIHIDDDAITVSLDPYRSVLEDADIFTSKSCDQTGECLTKIEFDIEREDDRTRYCGQMQYTVHSPYTHEVEEDFCLDR